MGGRASSRRGSGRKGSGVRMDGSPSTGARTTRGVGVQGRRRSSSNVIIASPEVVSSRHVDSREDCSNDRYVARQYTAVNTLYYFLYIGIYISILSAYIVQR